MTDTAVLLARLTALAGEAGGLLERPRPIGVDEARLHRTHCIELETRVIELVETFWQEQTTLERVELQDRAERLGWAVGVAVDRATEYVEFEEIVAG